jgi:hypothetical protein
LLAVGFSLTSMAGSIQDNDSDGVPDQYDNCRTIANGPTGATGSCNSQEDFTLVGPGFTTPGKDGYGNPCDFDYNNNGSADAGDLGDLLSNLGNPLRPDMDNNCNGLPDSGDLGDFLTALGSNPLPGPSDLPCAGTIPCSGP